MGQNSLQWNAKAEAGNLEWALDRPLRYWYCTPADTSKTLFPACSGNIGQMLVNDPLNTPGALRESITFAQEVRHQGGQLLPALPGAVHNQDGFFYALLRKA